MNVVMEYFTLGTFGTQTAVFGADTNGKARGRKRIQCIPEIAYLKLLKFYCSPHRCPVSASVICVVDHI
jgi:hypothetical protein